MIIIPIKIEPTCNNVRRFAGRVDADVDNRLESEESEDLRRILSGLLRVASCIIFEAEDVRRNRRLRDVDLLRVEKAPWLWLLGS